MSRGSRRRPGRPRQSRRAARAPMRRSDAVGIRYQGLCAVFQLRRRIAAKLASEQAKSRAGGRLPAIHRRGAGPACYDSPALGELGPVLRQTDRLRRSRIGCWSAACRNSRARRRAVKGRGHADFMFVAGSQPADTELRARARGYRSIASPRLAKRRSGQRAEAVGNEAAAERYRRASQWGNRTGCCPCWFSSAPALPKTCRCASSIRASTRAPARTTQRYAYNATVVA